MAPNKVQPAWSENRISADVEQETENSPFPTVGMCWNLLKILLTIGIPLTTVCMLAYTSVTISNEQRDQVNDVRNELNQIELIQQLIQNFQKESLATCIFYNTNNQSAVSIDMFNELEQLRLDSDNALKELESYLENQLILKSKKELVNYRLNVDDSSGITCKQVAKWYYDINDQFIQSLLQNLQTTEEGKMWTVIEASYIWFLAENFLVMKRAVGSIYFASGQLDPLYHSTYFRSDGASRALHKLCLNQLQETKDTYNNVFVKYEQLLSNISAMEQIILTNNLSQSDTEMAIIWDQYHLTLRSEVWDPAEEELHKFIWNKLEDRDTRYRDQFYRTVAIALTCLILCPSFGLLYAYHTHRLDQLSVKTRKMWVEEKKTAHLLYQLLPKSVASQLLKGNQVRPETYNSVTVFFSDVVGFTSLAAKSTPIQVVEMLNRFYSEIDAILETRDCYKVETIGDSYLIASGLPLRNNNAHSNEIASVALDILQACSKFTIPHMDNETLLIKIGIHTGPCVTGVVGLKTPKYCLFGDTINTASRMMSSGAAMCAHISEAAAAHLQTSHHQQFQFKCRGQMEIKGKGSMTTYWLISKKNHPYIIDLELADQMYKTARYYRYEIWLGGAA